MKKKSASPDAMMIMMLSFFVLGTTLTSTWFDLSTSKGQTFWCRVSIRLNRWVYMGSTMGSLWWFMVSLRVDGSFQPSPSHEVTTAPARYDNCRWIPLQHRSEQHFPVSGRVREVWALQLWTSSSDGQTEKVAFRNLLIDWIYDWILNHIKLWVIIISGSYEISFLHHDI